MGICNEVETGRAKAIWHQSGKTNLAPIWRQSGANLWALAAPFCAKRKTFAKSIFGLLLVY